MSVVPLTLTISLCLVFTFVIFFLREHARGGVSSAERDSLLPLAEETPHVVLRVEHHDHDVDDRVGCGCHDGSRPPCAGCLKNHV
jgi:hypothetical protein